MTIIKKSLKYSKGFTLIELLVVIAIIGILASVILASLNSARTKGYDAAIKSDISNAVPQAELFYDANGNSYYGATSPTRLCASLGSVNGVNGVWDFLVNAQQKFGPNSGATPQTNNASAGTWNTVLCHSDPDHWVISAPLSASTSGTAAMWCADSTGFVGPVNSLTGGSYYACR